MRKFSKLNELKAYKMTDLGTDDDMDDRLFGVDDQNDEDDSLFTSMQELGQDSDLESDDDTDDRLFVDDSEEFDGDQDDSFSDVGSEDDQEDDDIDDRIFPDGEDENIEDGGDNPFGDSDSDSDELDAEENPDPDFQGTIRTVKGANLVYKRQTEEGTFEELWIYNVGKDIKRETKIRRAVLAGTDIEPSKENSQDGAQRASTRTLGNVQFLQIEGLPN